MSPKPLVAFFALVTYLLSSYLWLLKFAGLPTSGGLGQVLLTIAH